MADEEGKDGEEGNEWSCGYFFPHRWKKPIRRHLQFCPQRLQRQVVLWQQELRLVLQLMPNGMHSRRFTYSWNARRPRSPVLENLLTSLETASSSPSTSSSPSFSSTEEEG